MPADASTKTRLNSGKSLFSFTSKGPPTRHTGQLHVHTRASDGEVTADDVLAAGLAFVGATDHDTLDGWHELAPLTARGVEVVPGVELSVRFGGRRFHVLALEPCPTPDLGAMLAELQRQRRARINRVADLLGGLGYDLSAVDHGSHRVVTKRDLIDAVFAAPRNAPRLACEGLTDPKRFGRRFFHGGPADIKVEGLPMADVLPAAGGAQVLAHPGRSLDLSRESGLLDALLRLHPMAGIEVRTRKHRPRDVVVCARAAEAFGLVPVTSNDAHTPAQLDHNRAPTAQLAALRRRADELGLPRCPPGPARR